MNNHLTPSDGGPAFPESYIGVDRPHEGIGDGMTLRDYFAAKAMPGCMGKTWAEIASCAYALADAMLAERAK